MREIHEERGTRPREGVGEEGGVKVEKGGDRKMQQKMISTDLAKSEGV